MPSINDRLQRVEQKVADRVLRKRLDFLRAGLFYLPSIGATELIELPIQSFEDLGQATNLAEQMGFALESGSRIFIVEVARNWLQQNRSLARGYTWKIRSTKDLPLKNASLKDFLEPNDKDTVAVLTFVEFNNV
jgi:hypothetical protein